MTIKTIADLNAAKAKVFPYVPRKTRDSDFGKKEWEVTWKGENGKTFYKRTMATSEAEAKSLTRRMIEDEEYGDSVKFIRADTV